MNRIVQVNVVFKGLTPGLHSHTLQYRCHGRARLPRRIPSFPGDDEMWTDQEKRKLKKLAIDSSRTSREDLIALIRHFKAGGTLFDVTDMGQPVHKSQALARKLRELTQAGKLDWLESDTGDDGDCQGVSGMGPEVGLWNLPRGALAYEINRNGWGLVEVAVPADLENRHRSNDGVLRRLALEIQTTSGTFIALAELPIRGTRFEPGFVHHSSHLFFRGAQVADGGKQWDGYIRGQNGQIILDVSGQPLRRYPVRLAGRGKVHR